MYQYIFRLDSYYTNTNSTILGSPLPKDGISFIGLGKLKMEHFVKKGILLAPMIYILITKDVGDIIKHKGPAKDLVNVGWFKSRYTLICLKLSRSPWNLN